jgi:hypothetical protein
MLLLGDRVLVRFQIGYTNAALTKTLAKSTQATPAPLLKSYHRSSH